MLTVDFYESADGETTIVTFPDGGLGVVDAYPSYSKGRPTIVDLVKGKNVHFVCLTHPHVDHGVDLAAVFGSAMNVSEYWHTVSDSAAMFFAVTEQRTFQNRFTPLVEEMRASWAKFLLELYRQAYEREDKIPGFVRTINAAKAARKISGVEIEFLGPEESEQNSYVRLYRDIMDGKHRNRPDPNSLSAIIALRYGPTVVLLGSDALKKNWVTALKEYASRGLPKAAIIKIPHHGAENAYSREKGSSYVESCASAANCTGVLFGGDPKHPHPAVFTALKTRMKLLCLTNGLKTKSGKNPNPLNISVPGAHAVGTPTVCNPHVGFEIHLDGQVIPRAGAQCEFCRV